MHSDERALRNLADPNANRNCEPNLEWDLYSLHSQSLSPNLSGRPLSSSWGLNAVTNPNPKSNPVSNSNDNHNPKGNPDSNPMCGCVH